MDQMLPNPALASSATFFRKLRFAIGGGLIAILFGLFFYSVVDQGVGTFQYYHTLSEFKAAVESGAMSSHDGLRLNGKVVPGTIQRDMKQMQISFRMTDGSVEIPVLLTRMDVSDLFKDDAQVVVEGRYGTDGVFVAEQLLAKCPTKYEAAEEKAPSAS